MVRGRGLAPAAAGVLVLVLACSFEPRVPAGKVICNDGLDCPSGYLCRPTPGPGQPSTCCPADQCSDDVDRDAALGGDAPAEAAPAPHDAGSEASSPAAPDASTSPIIDAEAPLRVDAVDAAIDITLLICTRNFMTPVVPARGERLACTIALRDSQAVVAIDGLPNDDPVAVRTHGQCWTEPPLGAETTDLRTGAARPLSMATLDHLVALTLHFRKLCELHHAPLTGVDSARWARQATNQSEVRARFKEGTGLELEIPSPEREVVRAYLGVTRQRRNRIMVDSAASPAELVLWRTREPAPARHVLPLAYRTAGNLFFSNSAFASFAEARVQLHTRLHAEMRGALVSLADGIATQALPAEVSVGPGTATVALALGNKLRSTSGLWSTPVVHRMKLAAAPASDDSEYGRVFSTATPGTLADFFASIDANQFAQLRISPVREAYGEEVMLLTSLLELLATEIKATEFGFVVTQPHYGFLFEKLQLPLR